MTCRKYEQPPPPPHLNVHPSSVDVANAGDPDEVGVEYLEVFCNPNAYSTAFEAKLLITLVTQQGLKVTTEARLSAVKSDIDHFVESHPC